MGAVTGGVGQRSGVLPDDPADFVALLREHDPTLRAAVWRLLGDRDLMDDALQEAYLRAYRARASFRGEAPVGAWLHRIAHNTCLDLLRRESRQQAEPYSDGIAELPSAETDPGEVAALRGDLAAALAALPAEQRTAVLLIDGQGMDYLTAARLLGVGKGTVGSRVSRGRAALRAALASREGS